MLKNHFKNNQARELVTNPLSPGQPIKVYTLKEVASSFSVTIRTLYNWKERGILPCTVIGSKTYLTEAQLQEFLKNHEVKPVINGRVK